MYEYVNVPCVPIVCSFTLGVLHELPVLHFRPTMIKYGLNNIRELVGHKVNLQMVHDNPLCRLDK